MSESKKIHILDLCEKMPESLREFFAKLSADLVTRESASDYEQIDFAIVDSEEGAKIASKDFSTDKNEIAIVCLSQVKETRSFLLGNGRLTIDPEFIESKLGEAILSKFFGANFNIHLDESFSGLFPDVENFKVTNHLALGTSLDELALKAFENDFNIVALRSFLDHALIYFTYLKQAGLAGIPFEVEYSSNQDFFAVNIHAPVKNFAAEYLLDSFGSVNSKDPIQYLLGVTSRAADFTDITHVENPGRLVVSGFWSKSSKRRLSGLAFNNIKTTAQMSAQLDKKIKAYQPAEEIESESAAKAEDLRSKSLPGGILAMALSEKEDSIFSKEPEKASSLIAFAIGRFEEVHPDESINDMTEEDLKRILSEHPDQDAVASLSSEDRDDLLDKIQKKNITDAYNEEIQRAREALQEDDSFKREISDNFSEEVVKRVSGHLDADALNRILGSKDEGEQTQRIGGKEEVDNFKAVVKGVKDNHKNDFAQRISGNFESKAGEFKAVISGGGDPKKGLFDFVNQTIKGIDDLDFDKRAKDYFKVSAPDKIAIGLEKHALNLGLSVAELEEKHLMEFKETMLPSIIEATLSDEMSIEEFVKSLEAPIDQANALLDNASPEFRDKFKVRLEERLDQIEGLENIDGRYVFTDETVEQDRAQQIIQEAMKAAMEEEFRFSQGSKDEIEENEKRVIQEFSKTLEKDTEEVAQIVKGAAESTKEKETQKVVANLFKEKPGEKEDIVVKEFQKEEAVQQAKQPAEDKIVGESDSPGEPPKASDSKGKEEESKATSLEETHILKRLKQAEQENKKLKDSLKAMQVKVAASKETNKTLEKVDKQAKEEISKEAAKGDQGEKNEFEKVVDDYEKAVEAVNKQALDDLKNGKAIAQADAQAIARALEREQKLLQSARDAQANIKKLEVEFKKKESLFLSEVNKANKTIKAKDLVVEKVKDSMQNLVEKKHGELLEFKKQNELLNQRLKDDRASKLDTELKRVRKEYESTAKIAEMYKNKVENMLKTKAKSAENSQSEQLASENRTLSRLNIQLENKLNAEVRDKKSIETQFVKLKGQEGKLRARAAGAEGKYKKALDEIDKLKANEARLVALANKKDGGGDSKSAKEIEALKATNTQLQDSLKAMAEKIKSGAAGGAQAQGPASTKEKQYEQKIKNLNSELSKAKNEVGEAKKQMMKMKSEATALKNKIKQLEKAQAGKKKAA